ncbi:MAG: murein biosynthesis integral membrane protein MurJ [Candidatus Omnitrophota bacterium]
MKEKKTLITSTRLISAATLASRVLGFIRDVVIAKFFGTTLGAQAFVVAFRIPNLLSSVVGESSVNSAVVPVLSHLREKGQTAQFWQVSRRLLTVFLLLLGAIVLLGEAGASYLVKIAAPGFIAEPETFALTVRLIRMMFPCVFFIGLVAYAMAVLNSLRHFTLPALAPCMMNIGLIASVFLLASRLTEPVEALAWGVLAGGALQVLIQVPMLWTGLFTQGRGKPLEGVSGEIRKIIKLMIPRTLGIAVYQANVFVDTILATFSGIVGQGAVAALYYANRLVQFPLSLFAIALSQVATPVFSSMVCRRDIAQLKESMSFTLRSVFVMMVPATAGLMVLASPLIKIIFERGSFTAYSTRITSCSLLFYSLALTGYAGVKVLGSCFYAFHDTVTPVKAAGIALGINVLLNVILMWPLKVAGLALATSVSVTVNFLFLLAMLSRKIGRVEGLWISFGRVSLAAGVMSAVLWLMFYRGFFILAGAFGSARVKGENLPLLCGWLLLSIAAALLVYWGALKVFAREEEEIFSGWITGRK